MINTFKIVILMISTDKTVLKIKKDIFKKKNKKEVYESSYEKKIGSSVPSSCIYVKTYFP